MDEATDSASASPKRLRYDRETILAIKEHAAELPFEVLDKQVLESASLRSTRGKPKISISKPQDRSKDLRVIFLGPHKRSWNTGCHVSQSSDRDVHEGNRGGKSFIDYRPRHSGDYKTEFRGGIRERGTGRRNDAMFSRSHTREGRFKEVKPYGDEDEPEWFSEGPTTVNDTIELGRVLEDDDDSAPPKRPENKCLSSEAKVVEVSEVESTKPAKVTEASVVALPQLENRDVHSAPRTADNQGSRFKHLFAKSEKDGVFDVASDKVNDQLLKLLKGSSATSSATQRNNVSQVESKLRSMLLGHNLSRTTAEKSKMENKITKPQVLTVEEIEAQLSIRSTSPRNTPELPQSEPPGYLSSPYRSSSNGGTATQASNTSSLAPILQSLTLREPPASGSKAFANPFGIIPNPMAHIPSSNNATTPNSRLSQSQNSDAGPPGLYAIGPSGIHDQLWENTPGPIDQVRNLGQSYQMGSAITQPPLGPGFLSDLGLRSTLGLGAPNLNTSGLSVPRRPIVKAQQGPTGIHGPQLTPLTSTNSNNLSGGYGAGMTDVDRRLLNLAFKHQLSSNGLVQGLPDKSSIVGFQNARNDLRIATPGQAQPNPPLVPLFAGNHANNYESASAKLPMRNTNPNTLTFLSQLVEMERCTKPSNQALNPLLPSNVGAKTLDEIEHHELASSGSFF